MASKEATSGEKKGKRMAADVLTCSVCLERYRCPKLLPCFHTFCQRCVEKVAGTKPSFPCPACRTVIVMPPGRAANLQANFYLEKDLAHSMADDGPECELCATATATHKCVQCQQLYCAPCRQTHDSIPSCNSHTVLPLCSQGVDAGKEGKVETAQKNCPKHKGQVLILFCRQCEVSICIQCKLTSHDGHETEDVLDSGERARGELQKEVDSMAQREQVLKALLSKAEDFKAELENERQSVELEIRSRSEHLQSLVAKTRDKSLENLKSTTSRALSALQGQTEPVKLTLEAVKAKRQHYSRVINNEDEGEVLTLLRQLKREREKEDSKQTSPEDTVELLIERSTVQHMYSEAAVGEGDVEDFLGTAVEGPPQEAKIQTPDTLSVKDPFQLRSTKKWGKTPSKNRMNAKEIVYSKNVQTTIVDMCLATNEKVWIVYQFAAVANPLMALFDSRGRKLEQRYDSIFSNMRLACDGDTLVSLKNGKFAGPDGKSGNVGKLDTCGTARYVLSRPSPHYYIVVQREAGDYVNPNAEIFRIATVASSPPKLDTAAMCPNITDPTILQSLYFNTTFTVSSDEKFFAFIHSNCVYAFIRTTGTPSELKIVATYIIKDAAVHASIPVDDLLFCQVDGEDMLLVAFSAQNTVHVVDHKDGCCFVRTLETDQRPLDKPFRLATNHQGRVWIGCHGGKVVIFDL